MTATRPALRMARHRSRSLSSAAASAPPTRSVYAPSSSVPKPCVDYMSDAPAVQDPRGNLKTSLSPAPSTPAFQEGPEGNRARALRCLGGADGDN
jgi:hypothetical protein